MSHALCQQIDSDIAEVERLMTELRFAIAAGKSAGEDTSERERRVQELLKGWMQKAAEAEVVSKVSAGAEPQAPAPDPR